MKPLLKQLLLQFNKIKTQKIGSRYISHRFSHEVLITYRILDEGRTYYWLHEPWASGPVAED